MKYSQKSARQVWPETYAIYIAGLERRDNWSTEDKARGMRVLKDPQIAEVALQLQKLVDPETFAEFIAQILALPQIWKIRSGKKEELPEQRLHRLQRGAESFLSLIRRYRDECAAFLIPDVNITGDRAAAAKEYYATLEQSVGRLSTGAATLLDSVSHIERPHISRKRKVTDPELIFFVQHVAVLAPKQIGALTDSVVAALANACLDRKGVDRYMVHDICRPLRKKKK